MSLKNCPFCGANEAWVWPYDVDGGTCFSVHCRECGMGNYGYDTSEEAEDAWNRREG